MFTCGLVSWFYLELIQQCTFFQRLMEGVPEKVSKAKGQS